MTKILCTLSGVAMDGHTEYKRWVQTRGGHKSKFGFANSVFNTVNCQIVFGFIWVLGFGVDLRVMLVFGFGFASHGFVNTTGSDLRTSESGPTRVPEMPPGMLNSLEKSNLQRSDWRKSWSKISCWDFSGKDLIDSLPSVLSSDS